MKDIIIKAENLTKIYGVGDSKVTALDNCSFSAERGSFTAVTGTSGSGKSTLLHILGGMDCPDSGTVTVSGETLFPLDGRLNNRKNRARLAVFRRRNIGFIFQSFNLIPIMTVKENITAPLMLDGRTADTEYFNEIAELFELSNRLDSYPAQLSGGQQQRVAIARSLIAKPSLILADEPTGNLDTKNSREIIALLKNSIRRFHQTLVLITHDPEIAGQADRAVYMTDGRLSEIKC